MKSSNQIRALSLAAVFVLAPQVASAQFTSYIERPKPKVEPVAPIVAVAKTDTHARPDTVKPARLTDMKAWVDSAAVAMATPGTVTDTARGVIEPPKTPAMPKATAKGATEFKPGAPAPDTATPLPALAALGSGLLGLGLALLRRRSANA